WFSKKGVVLESCDAYVPWNTTCNLSCSYQKTLLDWRRICGASVPTTTVLKTYIQTYGPVYTVLYTGDSSDPTWRSTFGTYNGSTTLYYTGSYDPNHAVCIVGWDDTLTHGGGSGGWIVKNSWGTGWGGTCGYGAESGYFTIAYGSARIGEWSCYMQDWQTYDSNGDLLFYDEGGWTNSWGWGIGNPSAWGMCKFVPSVAFSLKRVEFWTNDITTDIDVYIYDTFSGGTLDTLLTSELDTSYAEVGYHSVALSSPPYVASGNDVYVAVKFTNSSYGWPVVADDVGPFETNKTYLSHYGSTWFEMGTNDSTDIAIRLRTTTGTMAPAISVSPDTLKFGQVQVSTDSILTLRVKNPGTDTLRVADINSSAHEFTLTDTLFSVAPSGSTNVSVTFRPTAVQIYSADLTILHNAKGSTVVPLTGEGVSAGAPGILVVPDSLKYGQVPVGVDSILTMRIKSTGTDTLHVTDIDPSDPTITLSDTAFVLAPSESTDVSVTFTPAAIQDYAESLTIFSDAVKAITVVSVTGEGIDNVAISVVPDTLKYGQVVVGSDSSLVLRVKSTGTDTLRVTDINPS
ncbi:choice-of-anchor D domain-containing protein, partial [bacterium]|nr:choice-of-anchor D domain-containing protein [bacterium]